MAVRIYEISKKLGLENREILAAAKALGINAAKIPSSSLDKITAEYLEEELLKTHPDIAAKLKTSAVETTQLPPNSSSAPKESIPRPPKEEATKLEINVGPISQKRPLAGIPEEAADCIVAIYAGADREFPTGVGCVISPNRILTTGQAVRISIPFQSPDPIDKQVWVSLPWLEHRPEILTKVVHIGGGTDQRDFLILLEMIHPPLELKRPATFATVLDYSGKDYVVAGFPQRDPQGVTASGRIGGISYDGKYELAPATERRLLGFGGSPIWSPELAAFIGIVSDGNPGWGIPASRICEVVPDLAVQFQIPKSDRPKPIDPKVDYNLKFFPGSRSEENGRRLSVTVVEELPNNWHRFRLTYELLKDAPAARGKYVTFVTYPNLGEEFQIIEEIAGTRKVDALFKAMIKDFTVAAIGDGGKTRLTVSLKPAMDAFKEQKRRSKAGEKVAPPQMTSEELEQLENTPAEKEDAPLTFEPPGSVYRSTYAAFGNDLVAFDARAFKQPLTDALGNGVYARHLAQLIIAKKTPLPLSLGLFGDWGAGKSYFMRLLHQEIEALSANKDHDVFCRKVVQIHFNAWHYLDTNLWANLVCEIFDNLFQSLTDREGASKAKVEQLKKKLAEESALAAEAKKALEDAKRARENAEAKLKQAAKEREEQENSVALFLDDLKQVAADAGLQTKLKELAHGFGLTRLSESYTELEKSAEDARSLAGRFRSLGLTLLSPEGRWQRLGFLIAALVIPVILALAVPWILGMKDDLAGFTRSVTAAVSLLGTIAAWISAQTKRGTELLNKLETTYASVKQARENVRKQKQPAAEQAKLDERIKQEVEAQHALQEAEAKVRAIESELRELAPGRRLLKFLEQRTGANDYRQHLGMVSLVRRDFKQLSDLLQEGNEFKEDGQPMLDRIVLYIDDLDRCKSARVIEVLEAVHLLLAFPLFAVVVAVDPRWLRKSLVEHYPTLLAGGKSTHRNASGESRESRASPQDFLEKIFQVPFQLERIEKDGFTKLVTDLLPVEEKKSEATSPDKNADHSNTPPAQTSDQPSFPPVAPRVPNIVTAPSPPLDIPKPNVSPSTVPPPTAPKTEGPAKVTPIIPERLQLERWEQAAVQMCHPLFRTPRAVKRLANTYCLIRSGVDAAGWEQFIGSASTPAAEYRTPLLMLAVAAAYPSLARQWFDGLENASGWSPLPETVRPGNERSVTEEQADWHSLAAALVTMNAKEFAPLDREQVKKWLPRVKRYSF